MAGKVLGTFKDLFPHLIVKQCCKLVWLFSLSRWRNINLKIFPRFIQSGREGRTQNKALLLQGWGLWWPVASSPCTPLPWSSTLEQVTPEPSQEREPWSGSALAPKPACPWNHLGSFKNCSCRWPIPQRAWMHCSGVWPGILQEILICRPV